MGYTVQIANDDFFVIHDNENFYYCQRGDFRMLAVESTDRITVWDKHTSINNALLTNIEAAAVFNGDAGVNFTSIGDFSNWWKTNAGLSSAGSGGGGGEIIASGYPRYTSEVFKLLTISNAGFVAGPSVACDGVMVHNYSGGILEIQKDGAGDILPLQPETYHYFSGISNANQMAYRASVAGYNLPLQCITI